MILLSEDGKTLVKIDTWDDVIERPGYTEKVNPEEVTLKQIIGRYHIDPKQPCGIASCGTAHNMGYLVLCEGGIETNIGNKCGKRIFGVDFQTLEKTFTRATNAQRYRENISKTKNQLEPKINGVRVFDLTFWCVIAPCFDNRGQISVLSNRGQTTVFGSPKYWRIKDSDPIDSTLRS